MMLEDDNRTRTVDSPDVVSLTINNGPALLSLPLAALHNS